MFQVWLSKQCIGICAARSNMARIQDLLDDKCLNCQQPRETSEHLNWCPDAGQMLLYRDSVASIVKWMHNYNRTDAELAYWLKKCLIFRGTRSLTALIMAGGGGLWQLMRAAASQDLIGWTEFLHCKISVNIKAIQHIHCTLRPCRITGSNWMKAMSSHLMQASHCKGIFCNFMLHDRQWGYLQLNQRRDLLCKLYTLIETPSDDIPKETRYLLELGYSTLYSTSFKRQSYWVLAMKTAHRAGRRTSASSKQKGQHKRCASTHNHQCKPCYDFTHDDEQMRRELGLQAPTIDALIQMQMALVICPTSAYANRTDMSRAPV